MGNGLKPGKDEELSTGCRIDLFCTEEFLRGEIEGKLLILDEFDV